jgi:carbon storage regulator
MIGDEIEIKILDVSGEKVRVGIDAPREINVYRTEVFERIESEYAAKKAAGNGAPRRSEKAAANGASHG